MDNAQPEPSMEEILASIRRIIAEDEEDGDAAVDASAEEAEVSEPVEPTPISSVRAVEPEPEPTSSLTPPTPVPPTPQATPASRFQPTPQPAPAAPVSAPAPAANPVTARPAAAAPSPQKEAPMSEPARTYAQEDDENYMTETSAAVAASAFEQLSANVRVSDNGATLEDIVAKMLRPMLQQWIDENLPVIVEEKVEMEIKRIARRR